MKGVILLLLLCPSVPLNKIESFVTIRTVISLLCCYEPVNIYIKSVSDAAVR